MSYYCSETNAAHWNDWSMSKDMVHVRGFSDLFPSCIDNTNTYIYKIVQIAYILKATDRSFGVVVINCLPFHKYLSYLNESWTKMFVNKSSISLTDKISNIYDTIWNIYQNVNFTFFMKVHGHSTPRQIKFQNNIFIWFGTAFSQIRWFCFVKFQSKPVKRCIFGLTLHENMTKFTHSDTENNLGRICKK